MSAILEQPDDAGAIHTIAFESCKLNQLERSYPPHLLELLAVVHTLKTLRPYLLDKPFELHTDYASSQWLQQQRHVSHHQARWLDLLAEYLYFAVHIPGRTIPADPLPGSASLTARALRRTRAAPSRTRHSSCSPRPARLPRSWPPAHPPSRPASCTPTSRPCFARHPPMIRSWGPLRRQRRRRPPAPGLLPTPLPRRRFPRGASSTGGTGYSTVSARAATAFACPARFRHRCGTSSMPLRWAGTFAATRRWPWRAA